MRSEIGLLNIPRHSVTKYAIYFKLVFIMDRIQEILKVGRIGVSIPVFGQNRLFYFYCLLPVLWVAILVYVKHGV